MAATGKITSRYEQVRDIRRNANDNENALGARIFGSSCPIDSLRLRPGHRELLMSTQTRAG
jgi:hypothetical protein